jgi:uncharacterized membrane-anchored protein YhcB (DUF1043 family)
MGFEVWIVIVLVVSALSGWIGFAYARKGAAKQADIDAMAAELEEARQQAESVQANVSEHFEQSAMLFGKLAADYREFLDHFESSAQNLGLSEARARELIEQGFQPLLTHQEAEGSVVAEAEAAEAEVIAEPEPALEEVATEDSEDTEDQKKSTAEVGEVTVELPAEAQALNDETERKAESSDSDDPLSPERQRA